MVAGLFDFLLPMNLSSRFAAGKKINLSWFCFFLEINLENKVKDGAPPGCQLCDSLRTAVVRAWAVGPVGVNQSLLLHSFRFS